MRLFAAISKAIGAALIAGFVAFVLQGTVSIIVEALSAACAHAGEMTMNSASFQHSAFFEGTDFVFRVPLKLSEQCVNNGLDRFEIGKRDTWPVVVSGKGEHSRGFRFPGLAVAGQENAKLSLSAKLLDSPAATVPLSENEFKRASAYLLACALDGAPVPDNTPMRVVLALADGASASDAAASFEGSTQAATHAADYVIRVSSDASSGSGLSIYGRVPVAFASCGKEAVAAFDAEKPSSWPYVPGQTKRGLVFPDMEVAGNPLARISARLNLKEARVVVAAVDPVAQLNATVAAVKASLERRKIAAGSDPVGTLIMAGLPGSGGGTIGHVATVAGETVTTLAAGATGETLKESRKRAARDARAAVEAGA